MVCVVRRLGAKAMESVQREIGEECQRVGERRERGER